MTFLAKNVVLLKMQASPTQQISTLSDKNVVEEKVTPPGICYALKSTRNNASKFKLKHDTEPSVPRNNGMNSGRSDKQGRTNRGGEEQS